MKKKAHKTCSYYKPMDDLPYNQNYINPSCSHCVFYGSKNCKRESMDFLTDEFDFI